MKHQTAFKKLLIYAHKCDYIKSNPFNDYKINPKYKERDVLTQSEIDILIDKELNIERLAIVRDLFIFQCYTGLAFIDLYNLTAENISIGIDGKKWLITERQKTEVTCRIPLLPIPEQIINRYAQHPKVLLSEKLLPVPTNQRMNGYLKEIAQICGIKKSLKTHLARHTFATTITLSNGIPIESISKLLGHTKLSTTQIYAKIQDSKISTEFDALRIKLAN